MAILWGGRTYNIKKEICLLPKHMGVLGMIDLHTVVKVKRVKWVIRILKADNTENWGMLATTKYLGCLDKEFGIKMFVLRANECSHLINKMEIPWFYKECILNLQELIRKGGIILDNQDEIICGKNKLKFNNAPLTFKHWSKQGIHCISDMIKNGEIDREGIREKLVHKAGFMFEIQTIKAALPPGWLIKIERKRDDFTDKNSILSKLL